MQKRKNSFTLFEILIALFILSTALSAIGVQGAKLLRQERFERAMEVVSDQIDLAYELLILYQSDFTMTFQKQSNGILCSYHIQGANDNLYKKIARPHLLAGVQHLLLNGEKTDSLNLHFSRDHPLASLEIGFETGHNKRLFVLKGVV